ncbi:hypothetical protein O181_002494 [Austropuccinia psidii MF-1]|uniref:Uncharacterized protein n=1 Tax=Austropuccinia psidii MF-1 TaxID=1389203 RepID=A0A9Q3BCC8_9BASI|nr:hypothetical protein [Austropuccinia psidii MF-1]
MLQNFATIPPRSAELLEYSQKIPQIAGNSEILQWIESTITQASNKKDKVLEQQKEVGKQGRSPSSFYQQDTSQTSSPIEEEEQAKEQEEIIFTMLQDPKNPQRLPGKSLYGIQGKRGAKNETTPFPKEITLSPDVLNNLTGIRNIILLPKDIKNSLLSLTPIVVQNKKELNNIKFMIENNKPEVLIDNSQKLIRGQQDL